MPARTKKSNSKVEERLIFPLFSEKLGNNAPRL
jgi:hypothetical protein